MIMPVVDSEDRLVGIVTVDDAIDVIQEEATEDISKMAAVTPADKPYLRLSVFEIWRSRIPWLLILMISATFTGLIITHYENALATYVALTAFIPMDVEASLLAEALIREYQNETGCIVILITHSLPQAARAADNLIFLHAGAPAEWGRLKAMMDAPRSDAFREYLDFCLKR